MFFSKSIAVLAPLSLVAASPLVEQRDGCSDVHLFLARGNGEGYPGRVGALGDAVCDGLSSCDYENIMFVSTNSYCQQAGDGASAGQAQVAAYAAKCPKSKLILGGYSLGAQIVGDVLGGGGGSFYDCTENTIGPLSSSLGSQIAAVLLFGDVRHVANQGYNVGDGSGSDGQYPRSGSGLSALNAYGGKMHSYCMASDPICALGNDGKSHETYMDVYAKAAGDWVHQVLNVQTVSSSISPASSSAKSSSSASVASSLATNSIVVLSKSASTTTSGSASATSSGTSATSSATGSSASGSSSVSSSGSVASSTGSSSSAASATGSGSASPTTTSSTGSSASGSGSVADSSFSSSSATTTGPANTATFAPFVFSSATGAAASSTTTVAAAASSDILPFSQTATNVATTISGVATSVAVPTTVSVKKSTASPTPIASTSHAGAGSHGISMTLLTMVVVKVLAF